MKKKDKLTLFLARQLLYDFAKGKLDSERRKAFEAALEEFPELKIELRAIQEKLDVLKTFDAVKPSEQWVQELSLPHPSLAQQIAFIEKRVVPRFWRGLPVVILLSALAFGAILFQPWSYLNFNELEVAQVQINDDEIQMEAALALSEKDIEGAMQEQTASVGSEEESAKIEVVDASKESVKEAAPSPPRKQPRVGELFRAFMTVNDLNSVTSDTVQKIISLGGKKAGQVQLGWEREEDERYFHFSIPENNKQALLDFLSNFSQVRLSSQEHPLVMPEGKIRIILVMKRNPQAPPPVDDVKEESSESEKEDPST